MQTYHHSSLAFFVSAFMEDSWDMKDMEDTFETSAFLLSFLIPTSIFTFTFIFYSCYSLSCSVSCWSPSGNSLPTLPSPSSPLRTRTCVISYSQPATGELSKHFSKGSKLYKSWIYDTNSKCQNSHMENYLWRHMIPFELGLVHQSWQAFLGWINRPGSPGYSLSIQHLWTHFCWDITWEDAPAATGCLGGGLAVLRGKVRWRRPVPSSPSRCSPATVRSLHNLFQVVTWTLVEVTTSVSMIIGLLVKNW